MYIQQIINEFYHRFLQKFKDQIFHFNLFLKP